MKLFCVAALLAGLIMIPAVAQVAVGPSQPSVEVALSEAPSALWIQPVPVVSSSTNAPERQAHVFFDRPGKIRFSVLAGLIAADGVTTQYVLNMKNTREANPLARPFVTHGAVGQVAASSLGYAFGLGTSYVFHRTGHHKMERIVENLAIGVEGACVTNNLIQGARTNP